MNRNMIWMIRILTVIIFSLNTNGSYAQKATKQQVKESIQALKAQIEHLQNELNLPTVLTAYDKNGVKYEIKDCFRDDGSWVIKIEVSSSTRRTINISGGSYAYLNGYWLSSYHIVIVGEDFSNVSHDCLLKPDIPQIIYKYYQKEADSYNIVELNKVRMVDHISIKEELSNSILDFSGIPIEYEE